MGIHILQTLSCIPKRLFRLIVPITLVFCFSLGFSYLFILSKAKFRTSQKLSWQRWDVISLNADGSVPAGAGSGIGHGGHGGNGTEWWEKEELDAGDAPAGTSLPLDVWSPLLPHATGLTEIAIRPCLLPPDLGGDLCRPKTTPEEDALKGKWVLVTKDMNRKTGLWYLNLYYRRTRRLDVPLITSIHLLPHNISISTLPGSEHSWVKASGDLHDGLYPSQPPLFLYYQVQKPLAGIPEGIELETIVTELDINYGLGDRIPWGFQKVNLPIVQGQRGSKPRDAVWITFRKGMKRPERAHPLHFNDAGRFKILQVADLHYSVSEGSCRDLDTSTLPDYLSSTSAATGGSCRGDTLTRTALAHVLSVEKPDLVIFTGDQLNGQTTSWDAESVILKAVGECIDAEIPWTIVFGNHDAEDTDLSKSEMMRILRRMPMAMRDMDEGPSWVDGVGNYMATVRSADPSATPLLTLYFLDSHAYAKTSAWTFWKPADYDWIKQSQIDWYLEQSQKVNAIERPFTPDGAKDIGNVWARAEKTLAKPIGLMFFHIPLPESYDQPDVSSKGETMMFGQQPDGEKGSPVKNSGFFANGVTKGGDVKVIGNGHCHLTDSCKRVKGVWLCFGGGSSFSGYGSKTFERRFRIYEVSDYGETVRTYKRTVAGAIVDDMVLVGTGSPTR